MIRIIPARPTSPGRPAIGTGTRIEDAEGREIPGVTAVNVDFAVDTFVTAEVTVQATCEEVWAQPFMSEASFHAAAERYGYRVEKIQQEVTE